MIETAHGQVPCAACLSTLSLQRNARAHSGDARRPRCARGRSQDVGTRIYTYIYTMAYCLMAAKKRGAKVIVCDRPNPIGGAAVEGPMLVKGFESFVGLYPIPMRHGMTIGELARLFNDEFGIGADLEVVKMEGWRREMYADDAKAPWVMPSPNIPTLDSAIVYPGTVIFEGTSVSEGRGTTRPFELVGLPGVIAERFADRINALALPACSSAPPCSSRPFTEAREAVVRRLPDYVLDRRVPACADGRGADSCISSVEP